jgi:threonine synthase
LGLFMNYISTRSHLAPASFRDVVLRGLSDDGGLYVPENIPKLDIAALRGADYQTVAFHVIRRFVAISDDDLRGLITATYNDAVFQSPVITPLHNYAPQRYLLELYHGPTLAFKDVALQFLGRLFSHFAAEDHKDRIILGATSGDTGSAAIHACRGRAGMKIFILHPHDRTSDIQRRQMTCVSDANVFNIAVDGSFDDCQRIVKDLFSLHPNRFTAVNSINWARIVAQIVYYVVASLQVGNANFVVPTGNFGNIYAGFMAKRMGARINKLIIASNRNDILTRTYDTGVMRVDSVTSSLSPSMDIQVSSNFERYLFEAAGRDALQIASLMHAFRTTGHATLPNDIYRALRSDFLAGSASDDETAAAMKRLYYDYNLMIDPHTAVGVAVSEKLQLPQDEAVIHLACAHPAKFEETVTQTTGVSPNMPQFLQDLKTANERYATLPADSNTINDYITNHSH